MLALALLILLSLFISYIIYPICLILLSGPRKFKTRRITENKNTSEPITVLLSAYNEGTTVVETIKGALKAASTATQTYEIIIATDGSTDNTPELLLKEFGTNKNVSILVNKKNTGKNNCLNQLVGQATHELLVFIDANTRLEENSIKSLSATLANDFIGCASGRERRKITTHADALESADSIYMDTESAIKTAESELGLFFSCNGALFAVKKKLFRNLSPHMPNDLQTPLDVISQGYIVTFNNEAMCSETGNCSVSAILKRKRRIVSRASHCLSKYFLIMPSRIQAAIVMHKYIKWLTLPFLSLSWALSTASFYVSPNKIALGTSLLTGLPLALLFVVFILPESRNSTIAGSIGKLRYISTVLVASALGLTDSIRGKKYSTWSNLRP